METEQREYVKVIRNNQFEVIQLVTTEQSGAPAPKGDTRDLIVELIRLHQQLVRDAAVLDRDGDPEGSCLRTHATAVGELVHGYRPLADHPTYVKRFGYFIAEVASESDAERLIKARVAAG